MLEVPSRTGLTLQSSTSNFLALLIMVEEGRIWLLYYFLLLYQNIMLVVLFIYICKYVYIYILLIISLLYSNMMFVCLRTISSGTAGPIWLNFFLLAPSWSRVGFRPKKFWIRDPVFPEIRKTWILGYHLTNLAEIYR